MSNYNKALGKSGEETVIDNLKKSGHLLLSKNDRARYGELDIIAQKDSALKFIEVKTRTSDRFGRGDEAITPTKQKHILLCVRSWLANHPVPSAGKEIQVLVAVVTLGEKSPVITWLRML